MLPIPLIVARSELVAVRGRAAGRCAGCREPPQAGQGSLSHFATGPFRQPAKVGGAQSKVGLLTFYAVSGAACQRYFFATSQEPSDLQRTSASHRLHF
jgi:hypothetical protein